jgi:hypothetical protein
METEQIKYRKVTTNSGIVIDVAEQGNPYETIDIDKTLVERFTDGMEKPELPAGSEVIELGAPQPHELPHEKPVIQKEKTDSMDMKKALEIGQAIMERDHRVSMDESMETARLLKEIAKAFHEPVRVSFEHGELVIKTGVRSTRTYKTFKTLSEVLGSGSLARLATARLLLDGLSQELFNE